MKQVKITVTTLDGEVLDSAILDVPYNEADRFIEVRPVSYSMPKYGDAEILRIGVLPNN